MKKIILIPLGVLYIILVIWLVVRIGKANPTGGEITNVNKSLDTKTQDNVRAAAVAGSFYPANAKELDDNLSALLNGASKSGFNGKPRILIVPHAGIEFSGNVAAWGFKQLEGQENLRVILLGSSHTNRFNYIAVDDDKYWETPLGKVEVDDGFVNTLVNGASIRTDKSIHLKEHSLEVELIFLQKMLSNFKIVPIIIGQPTDDIMDALAQKLAYNFDENTLLVVSSDLSHYPDWETANNSDNQTINSILKGNVSSFSRTLERIESENLKGLETAACGKDAIKVALRMAELLGIKDFSKLKYENTGDVTGEKTQVVGYASILGYSDKTIFAFSEPDTLSKIDALKIARKTLEDYLTTGMIPDMKPQSEFLLQPLGAFVTLYENDQLRGCIGEFEPVSPLYKVIQNTAISSATKDTRFTSVTSEELNDIKIEISVMTPRKKVTNWQDIKLGKEGVVVQKGVNAGTFLPQVATDNNWDLEKFLGELCTQKAGLEKSCYKDPETNIYSFEVTVFGE